MNGRPERQQDREHLIHIRPSDWDDKYGPYGTPPDYTPPMTAVNNVQNPVALRIMGVLSALMALGGVAIWVSAAVYGYPMNELIAPLILLEVVSLYMAWWGFHLASRREKWMRSKDAERTGDESVPSGT